MKGTDASWEHDEEPPAEAIEFSDDEAEAEFKRMRRKQKSVGRAPLGYGSWRAVDP